MHILQTSFPAPAFLLRKTGTILLACCLLITTSLASNYREVDWIELIPDDDLQALLRPPEWVNNIEDGSERDDMDNFRSSGPMNEEEARYQQALTSSKVKPELDQQKIRIPGFVVPLAVDDKRRVTEFFLVPYFGACLHYPPPPPNQIIHVTYPQGLQMTSLYQPYWIEGVLEIRSISNYMGASAYAMQASGFDLYDDY